MPLRRLLALALATGLLPLALPLPTASAEEPDVVVTSVVREADGGLAFVHRTADSRAAGEALAARLEDRTAVVAADVAEPVHLLATSDDTYRAEQWGLTRLGAEALWPGGDGTGVTVAVLDTGVDGSHPELAGRLLPPIDLVAPGSTTAVDPHGHGTHVAGTVAALTGNGRGVASLAPGAQVLPVRVLDAAGAGDDSALAQGIVAAVDAGADVLNMSLGGDSSSRVLRAAVQYALGKGAVLVAAAGNSGPTGAVEYPAALPGVLAVAATTTSDAVAPFSTHGPHVDLAAPGSGIWSLWPGSRLARQSGTSMAAPFVAAAAALLLSTEGASVSGSTVPGLLLGAADDLGPAGRDDATGYGLLDVAGARAALRPAPALTTPAPAPGAAQPTPSSTPTAAPAAEPTPAPTTAAPGPSAPALTAPSPTAVPTAAAPAPAPVLGARISAAPGVVRRHGALRVSVRSLADGGHAPGLPVVVQVNAGRGWTTVRTGRTDGDGLVGWVLRPHRTMAVRAVVRQTGSAPATAATRVVVR